MPRSIPYDIMDMPWVLQGSSCSSMAAEVLTDSEVVAKWVNGSSNNHCMGYDSRVAAIQNELFEAWRDDEVRSRAPWLEVTKHIFRECNAEVDAVAKHCLESHAKHLYLHPESARVLRERPQHIMIFCNGSARDGLSASGCVAHASWNFRTAEKSDLGFFLIILRLVTFQRMHQQSS